MSRATKHPWTRAEAAGKVTAAVVGGPLWLVAWTVAAGAVLPRLGASPSLAAAAGVLLGLPAWGAAGLAAVLAPSGRAAWRWVGGVALLLAVGAAAAVFAP